MRSAVMTAGPLLLSLVALLVSTLTLLGSSLNEDTKSLTASTVAADSSDEPSPDLIATLTSVSSTLDRQEARLSGLALEVESLRLPSLTDLASSLQHSVVTVEAQSGTGSGFAIRNALGEIVILTNYHVVAGTWDRGGRTVTIRRGEDSYEGTLSRVSASNDLAAIVVSAPIQPLPARSELAAVGEQIVAMGSPYGLEGTLTTGVVSAIRDDRIQFSAAVSPGSSGGPLVDDEGRVIGVVVEKIAAVGFEGLSFAIPIETICSTLTSCEGFR